MTRRFLPPLEAGQSYRVADFENFSFGARSLRVKLTGEDTAILHLHLKNKTTLDVPASDEALVFLLNTMIAAHPQQSIDFIKTQPWWPAVLKAESPPE